MATLVNVAIVGAKQRERGDRSTSLKFAEHFKNAAVGKVEGNKVDKRLRSERQECAPGHVILGENNRTQCINTERELEIRHRISNRKDSID